MQYSLILNNSLNTYHKPCFVCDFAKLSSFHCELASCTNEYFIGNSDFLSSAPEIFMTPDVSPSQEVSHGDHWNSESSQERLLANNWEEKVGG